MNKALATLRSLLAKPSLWRRLKTVRSGLFFVFPSWQIGGAERVHLDILALFQEYRPICLITQWQQGKGLRESFARRSQLIYLHRWGQKSSFKPKALQRVARMINRQEKPLVFGSNNLFFYELIPLLEKHVKIIDLTHSFSLDAKGYEHFSLPLAPALHKRVVLGENSLQVYRKLYHDFGHPPSLCEHFCIIPNQVSVPTGALKKDFTGRLNVLFVARNSPEKRPELFFKIAQACKKEGLPLNFTAVGDFSREQAQQFPEVHFTGVLTDRKALQEQYKAAHMILVTSEFEGFPMVVLEALAQQAVPICTEVGEIPFYISPTLGTGYTVSAQLDESALIEAFLSHIKGLLENRNRMRAMAEKGQLLVKESFSPGRFLAAYKELLQP